MRLSISDARARLHPPIRRSVDPPQSMRELYPHHRRRIMLIAKMCGATGHAAAAAEQYGDDRFT